MRPPLTPSRGANDTRFHTLDGLRGLAAIAVLVSHIAPSICTFTVLRNWYAVDLFFMISGFVLCRTYEPRFASGLTPRRFMLQRYIRLYPLFALGVMVGLLADVIGILAHQSSLDGPQRATALMTGLAILPSPTMQATPEIMPLNAVGWSLFFELVANAAYSVLWPRLSKRALLLIVVATGGDLLWLAHHGVSFGGTSWSSFLAGFPRVFFSFFTGVLIARMMGEPTARSWSAWLPMPLLVVLLFTPWEDKDVRDVTIMMLAFPPLLVLAAAIQPRRPSLFALAGRLSYPIYAIHFPLYLCLTRALALVGKPPEAIAPWGGLGFLLGVLVLGSVLDGYDARLRRWLLTRVSALPRRPSRPDGREDFLIKGPAAVAAGPPDGALGVAPQNTRSPTSEIATAVKHNGMRSGN